MIEQRYFSLKDSALYLGLSVKTLYAWVQTHQVHAYKFGRVWRFDKQELDMWIHRNDPTAVLCYNPSQSVTDYGRKVA